VQHSHVVQSTDDRGTNDVCLEEQLAKLPPD